MDKPDTPYRSDELTLGEVLRFGGVYAKAFKRWIAYILLFSILCGALSFFYFKSKPTQYKARLSFMLNEEEGGQFSAMSSVLGDLGIPILNQRINIAKVLELSLSRKIIQTAILQKIETEKGSEYLANHIIDVYELHDKWTSDDLDMSSFYFTHSEVDSFTQVENIAIRRLVQLIAGSPANRKNALIETDYGQNTTIMSFVTRSEGEALSYHLTREIFNATSEFYVEKALEKQKGTFTVLVDKRDSLQKRYNQLEYRYAELTDKSTGLFSKKVDIKIDRARNEMVQVGTGLAKLEENIALVEFGIENSTPVLQVIDGPILPLEEEKTSLSKSIIFGLALGFIISGALVVMSTFIGLMMNAKA